jgi:hypothetical protein
MILIANVREYRLQAARFRLQAERQKPKAESEYSRKPSWHGNEFPRHNCNCFGLLALGFGLKQGP